MIWRILIFQSARVAVHPSVHPKAISSRGKGIGHNSVRKFERLEFEWSNTVLGRVLIVWGLYWNHTPWWLGWTLDPSIPESDLWQMSECRRMSPMVLNHVVKTMKPRTQVTSSRPAVPKTCLFLIIHQRNKMKWNFKDFEERSKQSNVKKIESFS